MEDFIYEQKSLDGEIRIEEITGGEGCSSKVWMAFARQIYCEHGEDYRDIGHFSSGAPFLYNSNERISISHTPGMLVVASLPIASDVPLSDFHENYILGVDTELADREKVMKLRERFLTEEELRLVSSESIEANVVAWTSKEAMYKAALTPGINWREDLLILRLPEDGKKGEGLLRLPSGEYRVSLESYRSGKHIVTICRGKS